MNEDDLFQLMLMAKENEKAAATQLAALEKQQAVLNATIVQAQRAIESMKDAGASSAGLIERAAKLAVEKAVSEALEGVSKAASDSLADALVPAVKAIRGAAKAAQEGGESLRDAVGWVSWKWAAICSASVAGLLIVTWSLAIYMTPSGSEIAELRANVADLESRGGKIKLRKCDSPGRLCAQIDERQINSDNVATTIFGANGERWLILKGY